MSADDQLSLFDLPPTEGKTLVFKPFRYPVWTEHKAKLIAKYLFYFVLITKHGAYIDGFAAPQEAGLEGAWSAELVLASRPPFLRDFWLCDVDAAGLERLERLKAEQPSIRGRTISVVPGDFNSSLPSILTEGKIKDTTAAFCLLDQRTFECEWTTLVSLASHKATNKIELFYFLGTGWLDRALSAVTRNQAQVERWWGRDDWGSLLGMNSVVRANLFCDRFKSELGYAHAHAWPIYDRAGGQGAVKYHMIHCTDHPDGPKLMARAYRQATLAPEPVEQLTLELERLTKA
jgi:three-Cys-motif partner protein